MSWNEEKVNKLKELWGKGNTASQIAEIIGGISRNAVIGKAHRLNLSAKIKTRAATSNQNFENSLEEKNIKSKRGRKSKFKSLIIEKDFEPENPKQLEELDESSCKWPIGHPRRKIILFLWKIFIKRFFLL
jgi:GcrA cell cycle regulator